MKTRCLFLDIDGVLNNNYTTTKLKKCSIHTGSVGLDPTLLNRYLKWYEQNQGLLDVVISSSWRLDTKFLDKLFQAGIKWVGITPRLSAPQFERGQQIVHYLMYTQHTYDEYAILDDINQFRPDQQDRFVQTDEEVGLTDNDLLRIERILKIGTWYNFNLQDK